ncbi:helix-turn-helix domain-containing protein [Saccharibacillus sp. CPCC 101409]|uniref:ArsR/SmtB family transcription factor n=1 Tax=Saccharibacillus sp. CPCC 101409 TaxID=3058041 RepID=UPI00267168F8|nr:helix-turn-helix domain-containing protein [Saccharibacillus sp. CPCC 101409]MDO3411156.1 helix-turn-helix domain-containing protein [Saccharibacillus sp. CPCC 101409]
MNVPVTLQNMPLLECFASETRVRIVELLGEKPMSVGELAEELQLSSAIVTKHVQKMEGAGLLATESVSGIRGRRKVCRLALDSLVLNFRPRPSEEERSAYSVSLPVGQYVAHDVRPTCGLASETRIVGMVDDPRYFADPDHVSARHLWFGSGYVEYRIPNYLVGGQTVRELSVTLELGSEAPGYNANWPSDIDFHIGGLHVGTWTCPGNFGGTRGQYTPAWWSEHNSQYGLLKTLSVRADGTFMDGMKLSDVTADDLGISAANGPASDAAADGAEALGPGAAGGRADRAAASAKAREAADTAARGKADRTASAAAETRSASNRPAGGEIALRIENRADAGHPGGVSLFGRGFGNYDRDIEVSVKFGDGGEERRG